MSSTTVYTQEELVAKLAAAEELVKEQATKLAAAEELAKKLTAELLKTRDDLNSYIEDYYGIKRSCCCHAAKDYSRGCHECQGDSDYEGECECR
jgi:hypothetical protein